MAPRSKPRSSSLASYATTAPCWRRRSPMAPSSTLPWSASTAPVCRVRLAQRRSWCVWRRSSCPSHGLQRTTARPSHAHTSVGPTRWRWGTSLPPTRSTTRRRSATAGGSRRRRARRWASSRMRRSVRCSRWTAHAASARRGCSAAYRLCGRSASPPLPSRAPLPTATTLLAAATLAAATTHLPGRRWSRVAATAWWWRRARRPPRAARRNAPPPPPHPSPSTSHHQRRASR